MPTSLWAEEVGCLSDSFRPDKGARRHQALPYFDLHSHCRQGDQTLPLPPPPRHSHCPSLPPVPRRWTHALPLL